MKRPLLCLTAAAAAALLAAQVGLAAVNAPSDLTVLLRFAKVAERAGYTADARLVLERAVELAPERADVAARQVPPP